MGALGASSSCKEKLNLRQCTHNAGACAADNAGSPPGFLSDGWSEGGRLLVVWWPGKANWLPLWKQSTLVPAL